MPGSTRKKVKVYKGVKRVEKVPAVELLDYDSGSHAMMVIPNTRNDPDLKIA